MSMIQPQGRVGLVHDPYPTPKSMRACSPQIPYLCPTKPSLHWLARALSVTYHTALTSHSRIRRPGCVLGCVSVPEATHRPLHSPEDSYLNLSTLPSAPLEKTPQPRLGELSVTGETSDSVHLSWTVAQGPFDSFLVQYKNRDGQLQTVLAATDQHEATIEGLQPGRRYKFLLYGLTGGRRLGPISALGVTGEAVMSGQEGGAEAYSELEKGEFVPTPPEVLISLLKEREEPGQAGRKGLEDSPCVPSLSLSSPAIPLKGCFPLLVSFISSESRLASLAHTSSPGEPEMFSQMENLITL